RLPAVHAAAPLVLDEQQRRLLRLDLGRRQLRPGGSGYLDVSGPYTSSGGSVSKLTAYLAGESSNVAVRGVVYRDAGGHPGSLVGVTPELTVPAGSSARWVDLPFSSPLSV